MMQIYVNLDLKIDLDLNWFLSFFSEIFGFDQKNLIIFHLIPSDHNDTEINGVEEGYYPNGSPYRIQRHAANIRERKRMLR